MTYHTLLAHISSESVVPAVLDAAVLLAEQHSAHLIGLHVQVPLEMYVAEIAMPVEVNKHFMENQAEVAAKVKGEFESRTSGQSFVAEWRLAGSVVSSVTDIVAEQVNTADLVIMSRTEGEKKDARFSASPRTRLMASGRPGIVVPESSPLTSIGNRVLVAWDGRRESTRAVFSALPMLRKASEVRLLRLNLPHQDRHHFNGISEELARSLARHDVKIELGHADCRGYEVAGEILGFAKDMASDLIVMGCYGHSPFREFVLGGTTRQVLEESNVPLFMSN